MDLIPYSKVKFETKLSSNEVMSRISKNTCIQTSKRYVEKRPELFEGIVYSNNFKIYRTYQNSRSPFLPIFNGQVIDEKGKTEIELKIAPHKFSLFFLSFVFVISGIISIVFYLNEDGIEKYFILISVSIYLLLTFSFHSIRKEYLQKIYDIVEGETLIEL